jgi:hypothetical protein
LRKKTKEKRERLKVSSQMWYNVGYRRVRSQMKNAAIQWTEQPTDALVSGGSVWPTSAPFWMGKN